MADTTGGAGNRPTIHRLHIHPPRDRDGALIPPQPKGSMKCIGGRGRVAHQLIEDDKTGSRKIWRARVTEAATQLAGNYEPGTPLVVGLLALFERTAAAKKRAFPTTRSVGDTDKLARMLLDALDDADVYDDDSRVVLLLSMKAYAPRPGAVVYVAPYAPGVAPAILGAIETTATSFEP